MPVMYPSMVGTRTAPERLVRDQLPSDSSRSYGVFAQGTTDTVGLVVPPVEVDSNVQYRHLRGGATNLEELQAWADSLLGVFRSELVSKLTRSSHVVRIDSAAIGSEFQPPASGSTSRHPLLIIQSLRVHPVFIGTMPTVGDWQANAVVTWGAWDPASGKWLRKGSKSLRTRTSHIKIHSAREAGKILSDAVAASFGMRGVTGSVEVLKRRQTYGGLHLTGDIGLHGGGEGDTKDLMDRDLDAAGSPSITGSTMGFRMMYLPDWYGFGGGCNWGRVDVNVGKSSGTAFRREEYYGTVAAYHPLRNLSTEGGSTNVHADVSLGYAAYTTDELFRADETLKGWVVRPEVGLNYTGSLFVVGSTLGYEWLNLSDDDLEWNDRTFRFGLQFGFRMFTGAGR